MDWIRNISVCLLCVLQLGVAFNIESESWKSFSQNQGSAFGYKIIQQSKRLVISDPLIQDQNSRGSIYSCDTGNKVCTKIAIQVPYTAINMSLGLSMTQDSISSNVIACGPTIPKDCTELTTYNGMCFTIKDQISKGPFPSSLRDCSNTAIDIAFLMDGSGSVVETDFNKMKNFIITLMQGLQGRDIQFAVAQFSTDYKLHIPFTRYINTVNINDINQMGRMTYTGTAINALVDEFAKSGRQRANRILVVITDGQSNGGNVNLQTAAYKAQQNNIIRYAIGVGDAFNRASAQNELNIIASDPDSQYVFKVDSFDVLNQLLKTLKANIIAIEGTNTGESSKLEFAQDGFDAVFAPDGTKLMSAVGAFQWQGGYFDDTSGFQKGTSIDSYSGYSMKVAKTKLYTVVILGAPRDEHKGKVIISLLTSSQNFTQSAPEPQIGAYYGAELCVVDLDLNTFTDLLLVSAPLHIDGDQEGQVFVYSFITQRVDIQYIQTLKGIPGQRGRFGLTLSSPADLNGDGFGDIVIGAPMEENGQGSIYIFNGRIDDINPIYSQRITGSSVNPGLRFFGYSLSQSAVDNSGDFLPDLAVGSKGTVNIFRTRPIVFLETTVAYNPSKIPTSIADCNKPVSITLQLCFIMSGYNKVKNDLAANINYTLKLDAKRQSFRASFLPTQRVLPATMSLGLERKCKEHIFSIEACPKDALNPLTTELMFTFSGLPSNQMGNLRPLLLPSIKNTSDHNLDFEIDCGPDNLCIDNIRVDFNFSGVSEILVGIMQEMNVTIYVKNIGENSYNNRIILKYPFGLSFRRFTIKQGRVECTSLDTDTKGSQGETSCFINKPIFKTNAEAVFEITYSINKESNYDRISLNLKAYSDNDINAKDNVMETTKSIDVKYAIYIAFIRHENTSIHVNFTAGKSDLQKPVQQILKVENDIRDLNFTIFIRVPVKIGDKDIWTTDNMQIDGCVKVRDEKPNITDFAAALKTKPELNCSVAVCRVFRCDAFFIKREVKLYNISGDVSSQWIEQTGLRSAIFDLVSTATLEYDKTKYVYFSFDSLHTSPIGRINTQVEVYEEKFPLKETIGGIVAGLLLLALITATLFKAGFFKSNYGKMLEEAGAGGDMAAEPGTSPENVYNE